MISFVAFALGLAAGSFLNAFIYRFEVQQGLRDNPHDREKTGVTVMQGRSFCPVCAHTLAWYDLIPLLSFLLLQGKCRYCKEKISFQYPLVELATGLVFLLIFWHLDFGFDLIFGIWILSFVELMYLWAMAAFLIAIFVYDLKHFLILDTILYPAIGLAFLWRVFEFLSFQSWDLIRNLELEIRNFAPLIQPLASASGAALFFFLIYVLSKGRAMGFGDVKLAFLLGLFLGWPSTLVALFLAFSLGAISGLVLIALKKKGLKSEVPFAPFLIAGTAITFFFGSVILDWYFKLFLV